MKSSTYLVDAGGHATRGSHRLVAVLLCATSVLFWACIATTQESHADTYCEQLVYDGTEIALFIDEAYYVFPRRSDGLLLSLAVRYGDLAPSMSAPLSELYTFSDPRWSVERASESALLYVYRSSFAWPSTVDTLRDAYPNGSVTETDWPGWIKFVRCTTNCSSAVYINEHWKTLGVDSVECRESKTVSPMHLSCWASDHISGVPVQYYFPSQKKSQFSEFRQRISTFMWSAEQKGREFCESAN